MARIVRFLVITAAAAALAALVSIIFAYFRGYDRELDAVIFQAVVMGILFGCLDIASHGKRRK